MSYFISPFWAEICDPILGKEKRDHFKIVDSEKIKTNQVVLLSWFINRKIDQLFLGVDFQVDVPEAYQGEEQEYFLNSRCHLSWVEAKQAFPFFEVGLFKSVKNILLAAKAAGLIDFFHDTKKAPESVWIVFKSNELFLYLLSEAVEKRVLGDIQLSKVINSNKMILVLSLIPELVQKYVRFFSEEEVRTLIAHHDLDVGLWTNNAEEASRKLKNIVMALKAVRDLIATASV